MPRARIVHVLVVDDNRKVRQGLRLRLENAGRMTVSEAGNGQDAVIKASIEHPDLILMDLHMPRMDGLQATREILAASKRKTPRILMLTSDLSDDFVVEAIDAGAAGYLLKNHDTDLIAEVVHRALDGEAMISPRVTPRLLKELTQRRSSRPDWAAIDSLSAAELRVVKLLASGLTTNEEIASPLGLSPFTVRSQLLSATKKLGLLDRTQLALWAVRNGLDSRDL